MTAAWTITTEHGRASGSVLTELSAAAGFRPVAAEIDALIGRDAQPQRPRPAAGGRFGKAKKRSHARITASGYRPASVKPLD